MAALRDALDYQQRQATLAELIQNEAKIIEGIVLPPAAPLSDAELQLIADFTTWCSQRRVRALPCRPEVAASFIKELTHRGPDYVLSMVEAIGRMHLAHPALPDVTASRAVWFVLEEILKAEPPPRSWTSGDKELWAKLPPAIRRVVAKREQERERGLRLAQNKCADELRIAQKKHADEMAAIKAAELKRNADNAAKEKIVDKQTETTSG